MPQLGWHVVYIKDTWKLIEVMWGPMHCHSLSRNVNIQNNLGIWCYTTGHFNQINWGYLVIVWLQTTNECSFASSFKGGKSIDTSYFSGNRFHLPAAQESLSNMWQLFGIVELNWSILWRTTNFMHVIWVLTNSYTWNHEYPLNILIWHHHVWCVSSGEFFCRADIRGDSHKMNRL